MALVMAMNSFSFPLPASNKLATRPSITSIQKMDYGYKMNRSQWRRAPFFVWVTFISIYCCIMFIHIGFYRGVRRRQRDASLSHIYSPAPIYNQFRNDRRNMGQDMVHIVETRFMQRQSHLIVLGFARLALFEAFCLPSMLSQTSSNFLWIIRADPFLHPSIVERMQQILKGRPNFILMGSNNNPEGFGRTKSSFDQFMRADSTSDLPTNAPVWNGDITLVKEAYERSASGAILLETRLDADDGLHMRFIEVIQTEALRDLQSGKLSQPNNGLWKLWCLDSKIEWHPLNPFPTTPEITSANGTILSEGYLILYSDNICTTPGLTFGYGPEASRASLGFDHLRHDEISRKIDKCNSLNVGRCVSRVKELLPGSVRARTATSAGMSNVITGNVNIDNMNDINFLSRDKKFTRQYFQRRRLWTVLNDLFSVNEEGARFARSIIVKHMHEIALENLQGQCTPGHSCKIMTKTILETVANTSGPG